MTRFGTGLSLSSRRTVIAVLAVACSAVSCLAPTATATASPSPAANGGTGTSIALGGIAGYPVANPRTHTLYVPLENSDLVDVINTAACNSQVTSGCQVVARARVGVFSPHGGPFAAVVDQKTDTVYVVNTPPTGAGTVTVFDGARCNATVTRGCGHVIARIKVGVFPVAATFNPRTRTVYVANLGSGTISVIDAAGCNAVTRSSCGRRARVIKDPLGPAWLAVDLAKDTVYAANSGKSGEGRTVSVINGASCNARTGRGCGQTPRTVQAGGGPASLAVDQATGTVYVADANDGTTSVINGARCNARTTAGCRKAATVVTTGPSTTVVSVDPALHTAFSLSSQDDTLSELNTRTCNGRITSGCPAVARNEQATFNPRRGYNPAALALLPQTNSAYLANPGGAGIVSVVSVARCNATTTKGCRVLAPNVPDHELLMTADPATNTIYAANASRPGIDVINGATCNAARLNGCHPVAEIPVDGALTTVGAVDDATHTLYAGDFLSNKVWVINTARCNATHTAGCARRPPAMPVGVFPGPPALDKRTGSLYVSVGKTGNRIAVLDAATCNATNRTGCRQTPAFVPVAKGTFWLAVSDATDTVYAPVNGVPAFAGDTVLVINGAECSGTDHSGCGRPAATVKVGAGPFGIAVNDRTHTVYVANNANGLAPGTVSMINEATCNGSHTAGCGDRLPTFTVGRSPLTVAVSARTDTVYVADFSSAEVSVINGATCNATHTRSCRSAVREQAVGSQPGEAAAGTINPRTATLYIPLSFPRPNGPLAIIKIKR